MSRKRQQRDVEDSALKDYNAINTKRPRYDLRYAQIRECCSLPVPQYKPCQHKYHLRPFDHRKHINCLGSKPSMRNLPSIVGRGEICANGQNAMDGGIKRTAHSYSINGHLARCSNSSTASGHQRTLQALKKGTVFAAKKVPLKELEEVS